MELRARITLHARDTHRCERVCVCVWSREVQERVRYTNQINVLSQQKRTGAKKGNNREKKLKNVNYNRCDKENNERNVTK